MSAGEIVAIVLIILIAVTIITIPILCSKNIISNCPKFVNSTSGSSSTPDNVISSTNTVAPITYVKCADEGGNCTTTLPFQLYAYTSGDPNLSNAPTHYKLIPGNNIACNDNTFGNPQAGTPKKCYSRIYPDNIISLLKSKPDVGKDSNWVVCAQENQICNIPSDKSNVDILYGVNGSYNYANVSKPIMCNNTIISGDPLPNVPKSCFYRK